MTWGQALAVAIVFLLFVMALEGFGIFIVLISLALGGRLGLRDREEDPRASRQIDP